MIWTLELPGWIPAPLNKLDRHWATRSKLKAHDRTVLGQGLVAYAVPQATGKRRVSVTVIFGPGRRRYDEDAVMKSTLDALKLCGAIKNDSPAWCEWDRPQHLKGPADKTFITIQDVEP
jgi:Holliday junction resolvase RusA-like endonuclease